MYIKNGACYAGEPEEAPETVYRENYEYYDKENGRTFEELETIIEKVDIGLRGFRTDLLSWKHRMMMQGIKKR